MKELLNTIVSWGPWGLFLGALLDGAGLTIPGGVDALVVFLAVRSPDDAAWLAFVAVVGSVLGNCFLFLVARRGGRAFLEKRASGKRARRFRSWFDRYGLLTVFVSALVPLPVMPMKIFVICSGALGAPTSRFLIVFLGARIPRYLGLAFLGRAMGNATMEYLKQNVWYLVGFAVILFFVLARIARRMDGNKLIATK